MRNKPPQDRQNQLIPQLIWGMIIQPHGFPFLERVDFFLRVKHIRRLVRMILAEHAAIFLRGHHFHRTRFRKNTEAAELGECRRQVSSEEVDKIRCFEAAFDDASHLLGFVFLFSRGASPGHLPVTPTHPKYERPRT